MILESLPFLPFLWGKKPKKLNSSVGNPDWTRAGIKEVAPGKQNTGILLFFALLINKNPGSLIPGVPASETSAISISFILISEMIKFTTWCSLCWW